MMLAFGMVCGLLEARASGLGQVIDASMLEGSALLMAGIFMSKASGSWNRPRGENWLDGGAPFYDTYECADGEWICIGSIEPQFYQLLRETLDLSDSIWDRQWDQDAWPEQKRQLRAIFRTGTRAEWTERMGRIDLCFAPVMNLDEVLDHPHTRERGVFVSPDGHVQPAPAPRFSRTAPAIQSPPARPGEHNDEALTAWGFASEEVARLRRDGVLADPG